MSIIKKEYLKVICVESKSTKLVKGATYLASSIHTYSKSKHVYLKDIGPYKARFFKTLDNKPLENYPDFQVEKSNTVDPRRKDYTGQYIRCIYSSIKSLKEGEIYYVEKQIKSKNTLTSWNGTTYTNNKHTFKLRGVQRQISSTYRFEEIPMLEQRKLKLQNLKGNKIKTGDQTRKFLLYSEKEKINILFEILYKITLDISKINNPEKLNLDLIDLMIKKGSKYQIIKEDIEPLLNDKIKNLLLTYEK